MSENNYSQFQNPQPYVPMSKRRNRWILPAVIVIVFLFVISIPFIIIGVLFSGLSQFESQPVEVSKNTVLEINLNSFAEAPKINPFSLFENTGNRQTLFNLVAQIENAKFDDRIEGIVLKDGMGQYGFGVARELITALESFKESGKFIYSYFTFANENVYMVASVSDSIFTPKMGFFELNGYGVSSLFLKGFFDKIGVDFYVENFEDYKSAAESFNRTKFSDSAKKQLRILVEQRYDEFINTIAQNRKINKEILNNAINRGQYSADSLFALKLVDGICTPEDFKDKVYYKVFGELPKSENKENKNDKNSDKKIKYVNVFDYATDPKNVEIHDENTRIAYIETEGAITSSDQEINTQQDGITDGRLIKDLEDARKDPKIKAIIIRINSPGGSALASDNIWYAIQKVRKEKPVYASMGDVAASGGYYISMACDSIIAYPNTITGSIGVISMVPNMTGTFSKLGLTVDTINVGNNSQFMNGTMPFRESDKAKFRELMKSIYHDFVTKAALSRKMEYEQLRALAKGRVWTGTDAYKVGLVDTLGTVKTAFEIAKKRLGIPKGKKVYVEFYPKLDQSIEEFIKFLKNFGRDFKSVKVMDQMIQGTDLEIAQKLYNSLPTFMQEQIKYNLRLIQLSKKENVLLTLPFYIQ